MRLLHFADIHVGMENYSKLDPETGLSTRLLDFFKTFDFIVDLAIKEKVDAVLFAGDAYKTRDPNPTQQRGFSQRIKRLSKANIPTVMIVGNHDTPNAMGKANSLDIYSALEMENVWVSREPEILEIPTKSGPFQIVTLPWLHKNDYKEVGDKIKSLFDKIKPAAQSGPTVMLSHAEIAGAQFGSEKGMAIANGVSIPLSLFTDRRLSYVGLGHIHKYQELSQKPFVVYPGSPERIDFGEEKEEKGICLVEISEKATVYKFIPTGARKFLTIKINLKATDLNPTQTILDEIKKHQLEDKIVRITINIPADLTADIAMDAIKKALDKTAFMAGISRNVERKKRVDIDTKEVETLTPIQALDKYFESKKYSTEKVKELKKYAEELFE